MDGSALPAGADDGALRFVKPDGGGCLDANACAPLGDWTQLVATHRQQGIAIAPDTATSRWLGERMDYGIAIDALLYRARQARDVPAGTSGVDGRH